MPQVVAAAAAAAGSAALAVGASAGVAMAVANTVGFLLTYVAPSLLISAASRVLGPKPSLPSVRAQAVEVNVRDPAAPRQIIYGQRKVSGIMYPVGVSGTNNDYLHILLLVAGHECEELGTIYFNDEEVPLDGSGNATGRYAGFVRIKKHLGAYDQTVDTDLQTDLTSAYWSNNHRLRGIAYLYIRLKMKQDLFAGGIPEFYCMVKGRKVWDPRDAGQSATDATTWTWSANAALCLLDWVRGVPTRNSAGTIVRNHGLRAEDSEINEAAVEEAANICDEDVTLDDATTENRYTANGLLTAAVTAADGIEAIKSAMAGECVYIGGQWYIRAGAYRTPTVTITDSDLRGPLVGVQIKPSRRELCNGVKGVYVSALNNWQPSDFPPVTNSTYTTQDGGERLWRDIELPFTTSNATAQRLAKIVLERSRQPIAFTGPLKLTGMQNQVTDVVQWTHSRFGWSAKPFEVLSFAFVVENDENGNPYLGVDLGVRETASGVWDWANGEETTVDLAPNTNLPDPFDVAEPTAMSVANSVQQQPDGTTIPRLLVSWTAPADIHVTSGGLIRIEYKLNASSDWLHMHILRGDITSAFILAVVIGQAYDVRLRAENNAGVASDWVEVLNTTVTGDTTAPTAVPAPTVIAYPGYNRVSWARSVSADTTEYKVARNTSNTTVGATVLGETDSLEWDDPTATPGTTYYYFVAPVDGSENVGTYSSGTSVATSLAPVGATTPSNPSAASKTAEGTYDAGDGTVFSFLTISVPALPTNAIWQNLLYRRNGASDWLVAAQLKNTGATSVRLDDLTPGIAYEVATQAWSGAGGSAITGATSSPFTAPNKSGAPTLYAGAYGVYNERAAPNFIAGTRRYSTAFIWADEVGDYYIYPSDFSHWEVKGTATNSDAATDYNVDAGSGTAALLRTVRPTIQLYTTSPVTTYIRFRAVNTSGVASAWRALTMLSGDWAKPGGDAMEKNTGTSSGTVAAGDDSRITGAAQKSNNLSDLTVPATARSNLGLGSLAVKTTAYVAGKTVVVTLSGGSAEESFNVDITAWGFGAKPNAVAVNCQSDKDYHGRYDWDDAGNSATNIVLKVSRFDGANTGAGNLRLGLNPAE